MEEVTRRSILKKAARLGVTALGMVGAVVAGHALLRSRRSAYPTNRARYAKRRLRMIRPPGAVAEDRFLAGCIRCYRCQDACERGAVRFFGEKHGELFHTPYVDPSVVACNVCMKCTQVCPTGVLRPMQVEEKAQVEMGTVELNVDACLSYKAEARYDERADRWEVDMAPSLEPVELPDTADPTFKRRGPCGECYMVCPLKEKALTRKPGEFFSPVVLDQCIGCGLCEEICRQIIRGEPAIRVVPARGTVGGTV